MTKNPLNAIARHFAEQRFWRWATPLLAPGLAVANPTGADVVGGAVAITNTDPNTLTINQGSATAAINWQNFSVGSQEYVIFNQPSASALALNRVVGGAPSEIFGHLLANGRVFLINPNGILFGAGSRIDVGALVASTANISDADFAAGRYVFNNAGTSSITNAGNIIAGPGGFVVLAADSVTNTGLIQASLGQVVLGAGNAFTLDLTGEGLINFAVDQAALSAQSGVTNLGQLVADGGKVLMTAKTAADLARTVVNNQGLVQARSISENDKGEIFLGATGGDVVNAGTLDASGINGANGGKVTLVSDHATKLASTSNIDAHGGGLTNGGSVHVSGHNVSVRGLLNVGRGGAFFLDPVDLHIYAGSATFTGSGIDENFIEDQLRSGAGAITITATHSITADPFQGGALDGRGSLAFNNVANVAGPSPTPAGAGNGGVLTLGIGTSSGGFHRGSGQGPGGGIHLGTTSNAIRVDRGLKIYGGAAYGDVDVGDLTAVNGLVDIDAYGGVHTGNIDAGGTLYLYNDVSGDIVAGTIQTGAAAYVVNSGNGDITVGNVTAHGSAALVAYHGNLNLNDVTVLKNPTFDDINLYLDAYGSVAGQGNINASDPGDTITVSNNDGAAHLYVDADGAVSLDKLVMHGGGGSSDSALPRPMLDAHLSANGNITVNAANLSTSPYHASHSSASILGGHNKVVSDKANAYVEIDAGGVVTLGETGSTGRAFSMDVAGDGTLSLGNQFGARVGSAVLNNVKVTAHAAMSSSDVLSRTHSYGGSPQANHDTEHTQTFHSLTGNGQINVYANGNVSVPSGGAVSVTADGDAGLYVNASGSVSLVGGVTVDAKGGRYYYTTTDRASSHSFSGALLGSTYTYSHGDFTTGSADVFVSGSAGIQVAGPMNVTGRGTANVALEAGESADIHIDNVLTVRADKGLYQSNSGSSVNGLPVWYSNKFGAHGDARVSLTASSGSVSIGNLGAINVTEYGGNPTFNSSSLYRTADLTLDGRYGVLVRGQVHVTGNTGEFNEFYQSYGATTHKVTTGTFHIGGAIVDVQANSGEIHEYAGAVIDVQGNGVAQAHLHSQFGLGGITLDGDVTIHSQAAGFDQTSDRTQPYASSYSSHQTAHDYGSYGSAFLGIGAYGGNVHLNGDISVNAPISAHAEIYAGAPVAHFIDVGNGATIAVTATGATQHHRHTDANTYYNSNHTSRYDGSNAYAGLELEGDGVHIGSSASVTVTGRGSANAVITSNRGRDLNIDGAVTVTGNRAYFTSGRTSGTTGGVHSTSHSSGSRGNASVDIHANNFGGNSGSYADVTLGSHGRIVVQDHGGQGHHTAASLQINAGGDIAIAGTITVDGDRGWHSSGGSGSQRNYYGDLHPFFNSSYTDRGSADVRIDADRNVVIADTAIITAHAYGDAHVNIYAGTYSAPRNLGNVTIDGQLKVRADKGASHSANTYHNYWSSGSSSSVTRYAGYGDRGDARLSISGSNVAIGSLSQVDVEGAGDAILNVHARDTLVVDGQIDVTATPGIAGSSYRYGHDALGSSESIVFAQHSENHRNFNSGSAYAGFDAGNHYGGALTINAPINVTGAGHAQAFFGHSNGSSQAITINAPVKVHDLGGAGSYGFSGSYGGDYPYDYVTNRRTSNVAFAGYGDATVGLYNGGYYGDVVVTSAGSIDVQAPGEVNLYADAARDLVIGGGVTLTADAGQVTEHRTRTFHRYRSFDSADIFGTQDQTSVTRAGNAQFFVYGARDLAINAPVTVTGHGNAFLGRYYGDSFRDVTVNAPVVVTDLGSSYKHNSFSHSDGYHGTTHAWHWQYASSTAGMSGHEFAHSGEAYAALRSDRNFTVTPAGSISVRGVEDAGLFLENQGAFYYGSGYGDLVLNGDVTVAAQKNDYHYHSNYTFTSYGSSHYNSHYEYTSNQAAANTRVDLYASRDLKLDSGATISIGAEGYEDANISANRDLILDGAVTNVQTRGHYDSHYTWHSGTNSGPLSSASDTTYFYDSDSGRTNLTLTAQRDLTVGGGITVTGAGNTDVTLTAVNGTLAVNGPIAVRVTTPAHYSSGQTSHTNFTSTDSASSYNYSSHQESIYGRASLSLQATGPFGGPGGLITIGAPVDVEGVDDAVLNIQGYNGIDITAPLTVTAHGGTWQFNSGSYGFDTSFGTGASPVNNIHRYDYSDHSFSHSGAARASINAYRGPVHIGAGVTVDGEGYAGLTLNANYYSEDTLTPARNDLVINGALTVNGHQGTYNYGSHSHNTYLDQNSAGETLRYASFSSSAAAGTSGRAYTSLYTGYGQILVSAPVNVAADGRASLQITAPKDVTLNAGVTVNGGQLHNNYHSADSWESHYGNSRMSRTSYGSFNGTGSGSATIRSYNGAVAVNAPITVTGATEAQLHLGTSSYYNRADQVLVNANITVDATGGYGGWNSYGNYTSYNSTGALNNWSHYTGFGSTAGGAAYFGAFANSLVHETAGNTISVHGVSASADIVAFAGNVQLDGAVSVTADAGHFTSHFAGAYQSNYSASSYGHVSSGAYGQAHLSVSANPLYTWNSSTSTSTASGGNVTLGKVDVSAPGFATFQATANGPGNVSISGDVTVTAALGQFANSRHNSYTYSSEGSGNYLSSHDSHGSSGAAIVGISGNAVTLNGALIVAGNGEANAHITANGAYGDAVLNGAATVTSGPGNVSRHDRGSHSAFSSSNSYGNVTTVVNHGGHAQLSVVSNQGNVTVNAASVSGAGSSYGSGGLPGGALLELRASNGAVTAGTLAVSAIATAQDRDHSGFYNSYFYRSEGIDSVHNNLGTARIDVHGRQGVTVNGTIDATAEGYAGVTLYGGSGVATANGAITITATRGRDSRAYNNHFINHYYGYTSSHYGSNHDSAGTGALDVYGLTGVDVTAPVSVSAAGYAVANFHAPSGSANVSGPVTLAATRGIYSGAHGTGYHSGSSYFSQNSSWYDNSSGSAYLNVSAYSFVDVGSVSINAEGNGDAQITSGTLVSAGPITITATRGVNAGGYSNASGYSFNSDSGGSIVSHADSRGAAVLYVNAPQVFLDGAVTLTGEGGADAYVRAGNSLVLDNPITVTGNRGTHQADYLHFNHGSYGGSYGARYRFDYVDTAHSNSSAGYGAIHLLSDYNSVVVNGSLSATGAGEASVDIQANHFGGSGSVQINAPITVTATRGLYFDQSAHSRTVWQLPASTGSPAIAPPVASSSGAVVVEHSDRHQSSGNSSGAASLTLYANGDIIQAPSATIMVSGAGYANVDASAYNGNVNLQGNVTAVSVAGSHFAVSSGHSNNGLTSYGSNVHGSYGAATISLDAYPRYSSSSSIVTVTGGNVTANNLTATGAGNAQIQLNAHSGGAIVVNGNLAADGGVGSYHSASFYKYDTSGINHYHVANSFSGDVGYGDVDLNATAGITVHGGVTVSGNGGATASFYASNGDVAIDGPVTVTSGIGHAVWARTYDYTGTSGYHNAYTSQGAADVGDAQVTVEAYNGGNVTLGNVTATGVGYANINLYASNGAVSAGSISASAAKAAGSSNYTNDYHPAPSYHNANSGSSHWNRSQAYVDVSGNSVTVNGGVTVTGAGYARANLHANGNLTVTGIVQADAQRGAASGNFRGTTTYSGGTQYHYTSSYAGSNGFADAYAGGFDISLGGIGATAAGDVRVQVNAGNTVAVNGPVTLGATRGSSVGQSFSSYNNGAGSVHSDSTHHWNSSAGGARLLVTAPNGVTLGNVTLNASGDLSAQVDATSGAVQIAGITIDAQLGRYSNSFSSHYTSGSGARTSTDQGHTFDSRANVNLDVRGYDGITVSGPVTVAGHGLVDARFSASNASADIAVSGPVSVIGQTAAIDEFYSHDRTGTTSSHSSTVVSGSHGTASLDIRARNGNVTVGGVSVTADSFALAHVYGLGNVSLGNVQVSGDTVDDSFWASSGALDFGSLDLTATLGGVTIRTASATGVANVAGNLTVTAAGPIAQTGALGVGGITTLSANSGDITLNNGGNDFIGAVSASNTSGNVQLYDANDILLGAINTAGNLSVVAVTGGITQDTSGLLIGGTADFTVGAGKDLLLASAPNDFAGAVTISGAGATSDVALRNINVAATLPLLPATLNSLTVIFDNAALALPGTALIGNLSATAGGPITQTGALSVGGTTTLDAGANAITLTDAGNDFVGAVSVASTTTDASLVDSNDLVLGASALTGNLSATAAGAITQTGALSVGGTTTLAANTVTLTDTGNDFVGAVSTTATDASLVDANSLVLGASTLTGNLSVSAAGPITQTGALSVGGTTALNAGANAVTLTNTGNDFVGAVSTTATDATLVDGNGLVLGASTLTGNLTATAAGPITQTGALSVGGATSLSAGTGDITLTNAGNAFGGVVGIASATNATLVDSNALALSASTLSGDLSVTAAGPITQTGALSVGGTTALNAGASAITLANAGNDFAGAVSVGSATSDLTLVDLNDLVLGASALTGNLSATAAGAITQTGALNVGGATSLAANTVTLTDTGNDFVGAVDITATDATLVDSNAFTFGASTLTGNLSVSAAGPITQTGALSVSGTTSLAAGTGNITLTNTGNAFGGAVGITATNATLVDSNALTLSASTLTGNLSVTAAGPITQTGALSVGGTTALNAGANAITLANAGNDFVGAVSLGSTTTDATLVDANDLVLGASALTGNLSATAAGAITQTGALNVGGATSLSANTVTLTNTGNDFVGAVDITATDATLVDSNAFTFGASTLTGNLSVSAAGPITQAGALAVAGTTNLAAGANAVTLASAGNDFGGAVGITASDATLVDANDLTLGAFTITNTLLASAGGDMAIAGAMTANLVDLTAAGSVTDNGVSGGSITAGALGIKAGTAIDLGATALSVGTGVAPFGDDPQAEALLAAQAPAGFFGDITPNGAFAAPSVTFGTLHLTGNAIYIQADAVGYAGAITFGGQSLPPSGFVVHYDTFTPDAAVHVVGALPGTVVAGDAYYDAGDFAYPGTTYLIGNSNSNSPMQIGENGPPSGGTGGDDNFFFMTDNDVSVITPIPTTGQVMVIRPHTVVSDFDFLPISADWETTTTGGSSAFGDEEDKKEEKLEHEEQTQTAGAGESEEGQIDNQSSSNLECH